MTEYTPEIPLRHCKTHGDLPETKEYWYVYNNAWTCKACAKHRARERYAQDPQTIAEAAKQWSKANRERRREISRNSARRVRKLFPERTRLINQRYFERNAEKIKANHKRQNREWRAKHPEWAREIGMRRRARLLSLPSDFTAEDWRVALEYFNDLCAYCDQPPAKTDMTWRLQRDHFIPLLPSYTLVGPNPGTVPANIVPCCQYCNHSKKNKNPVVWLTRRFGPDRAAEILARIEAYFATVRRS